MVRKAVLALLLLVWAVSPLPAQQWAQKMFQTTSHDFGSVARGGKAEFEFVLKNIYREDVHITGVRSSCGCTTPRISKPTLGTHEQGAVIARYNSDVFTGHKAATITVTLDKPLFAEVQLHVTGYIRQDVVLHPGSVQLGSVDRGTSVDKQVAVSYAGRNDWQIREVRSANPNLSAKVVETSRGGGRVSYNLLVHLDDNAPIGYIQDHLVLFTNDLHTTRIPVAVEGRVLSGIVVSPASLFMGVVQPGQKVTKQLVVRGKRPFRIISVTCDGGDFEFQASDADVPKLLHLIPVTFAAGREPGKVTKTIRIETDLGAETPALSAYAVVTPR